MADDRTYIRVHDGLDEHPKIEPLSDGAFRLLMTCWCYCSRNRTDGRIVDAVWKKRGTSRTRKELIEAGLVEQHVGYVEMHDYLEHQRSAQEIKLLQGVRGDNGSFGNHVRWHIVRRKLKKDCEHCYPSDGSDPFANASQTRSQTDRKPVASTEAEAEAEAEERSPKGGSHESSGAADEPPLFPDHCPRHQDTYDPPNCGQCADARKARLRLASVGPHNPATKPHCGECDEARLLRTRFGTIPCPNCNPAAEAS